MYLSQSSVSFLIIVLLRFSAISSLTLEFFELLCFIKSIFYSLSRAFFGSSFSVPLIHLLPLSIFFFFILFHITSVLWKPWSFSPSFWSIWFYTFELFIADDICVYFFSNTFIEVLFFNHRAKLPLQIYGIRVSWANLLNCVLLNKVQLARFTQCTQY